MVLKCIIMATLRGAFLDFRLFHGYLHNSLRVCVRACMQYIRIETVLV